MCVDVVRFVVFFFKWVWFFKVVIGRGNVCIESKGVFMRNSYLDKVFVEV